MRKDFPIAQVGAKLRGITIRQSAGGTIDWRWDEEHGPIITNGTSLLFEDGEAVLHDGFNTIRSERVGNPTEFQHAYQCPGAGAATLAPCTKINQ
jgi:hypothetical protein